MLKSNYYKKYKKKRYETVTGYKIKYTDNQKI